MKICENLCHSLITYIVVIIAVIYVWEAWG